MFENVAKSINYFINHSKRMFVEMFDSFSHGLSLLHQIIPKHLLLKAPYNFQNSGCLLDDLRHFKKNLFSFLCFQQITAGTVMFVRQLKARKFLEYVHIIIIYGGQPTGNQRKVGSGGRF